MEISQSNVLISERNRSQRGEETAPKVGLGFWSIPTSPASPLSLSKAILQFPWMKYPKSSHVSPPKYNFPNALKTGPKITFGRMQYRDCTLEQTKLVLLRCYTFIASSACNAPPCVPLHLPPPDCLHALPSQRAFLWYPYPNPASPTHTHQLSYLLIFQPPS